MKIHIDAKILFDQLRSTHFVVSQSRDRSMISEWTLRADGHKLLAIFAKNLTSLAPPYVGNKLQIWHFFRHVRHMLSSFAISDVSGAKKKKKNVTHTRSLKILSFKHQNNEIN